MIPVYVGRTMRPADTGIALDTPCYKLLHGRSLPCRSCPLPSLSPAGQEYLACELIGEDGNVVAAHACNLVETGKEAHRLALIVQDYTETAHEEIP